MVLVIAPAGVFALIAGTITAVSGDDPSDVAQLLGRPRTVLASPSSAASRCTPGSRIRRCCGSSRRSARSTFFRGIVQAQLVAFSTSSSAATLPVTMRAAEGNLGVSKEVASFVLPLGATINMDGTAVYMAVAAVFIAQTLGIPLDFAAQATIVFTALLASIGTAAVPSAGIVMLVIVLQAVGVPSAGIALILGVDRLLDMCRTATNVTGDAAVAAAIAAGERRAGGGDAAASAGRGGERMTPTRDDARALLAEYTKGESLLKHALAVEAAVRGYAELFGEDVEAWGIVGLLHDFDYERWPDAADHPFRGSEILAARGYPDYMRRAILSHADYSGVPRESRLEHTLFACDELAGFITAASLIRPTRSVLDLEVRSVKKRMKDKAFARAVSREDLRRGAEELGLPLEEHIGNVIRFLRGSAEELGLRGSL